MANAENAPKIPEFLNEYSLLNMTIRGMYQDIFMMKNAMHELVNKSQADNGQLQRELITLRDIHQATEKVLNMVQDRRDNLSDQNKRLLDQIQELKERNKNLRKQLKDESK